MDLAAVLAAVPKSKPGSVGVSTPTLPKRSPGREREPPMTCPDLDVSKVDPKLMAAMRDAHSAKRWPIYLYGDAGRGKSYAMAAVYTLWKHPGAVWRDLSGLLRLVGRIRASDAGYVSLWSAEAGRHVDWWETNVFDSIRNASLVCFDDIGLRSPTDAMYDVLYELVNLRAGKPTMLTGNLKPGEVAKVYDDRIASRILSGCLIEVAGKDRRLSGVKMVKV